MVGSELLPIAEGWSLLRTAVLRGAGFPASLALELAGEAAAAACDRSIDGLDSRARAEEEYESARLAAAAALCRFAERPDIIEALTWQNRGLIASAIRPFLANPTGENKSVRKKQRLLASYLTRYCLKNDTVGFFGPIGWATLDDGSNTSLQPGPQLLAARDVSLEHWAADALARALSVDLKPSLAPRLMPAVRLDGEHLVYSDGRRVLLPGPAAAILGRADGERSATAIADELGLDAEDVLDLLEQLADKGIVIWSLEVPVGVPHPEQHLRSSLARLGATDALAQLDRVESARQRVAGAAGDAARLHEAAAELERTFTSVAGEAATRRGGETYGARAVFYEDCVRDVKCVLGKSVVDRISSPLSLVLKSARWFTHRIAIEYEARARRIYEEMAVESPIVPFQQLWERMEPEGLEHATSLVEEVRARLGRTWSELLGATDPTARWVARSSESLRARVHEAFAAPAPGWPSARFHSPDLLLGAENAEAMERGDFIAVLGELHVSLNTLLVMALAPHLPPDAGWGELSGGPAGLAPVPPKSMATRAMILAAPHQLHLETGSSKSPFPRERVVAIAELVVEELEGRLFARTIDGRRRLPLLAALEGSLSTVAHSSFRILPEQPHTPRVTIDQLVIARESWSIPGAELELTREKTPFDRFLSARRWARRLELPRFLFAKLSNEAKPFYLDLESPLLVEILAHRARGAERLTLSEMLPTFDRLWLVDHGGRRYTSELRIVAVDPIGGGEEP